MSWNVTADLYAFFGFAALLGIIMYYWSRAVIEVRQRQVEKILENAGVVDIEQDFG